MGSSGLSPLLAEKKKSQSGRKKRKGTERLFPLLLILCLFWTWGIAANHFQNEPFLRPLTQQVFTWIHKRVQAKGIHATFLKFEDVHWKFPDRVFWRNVSIQVSSRSRGASLGGVQGIFRAREIEVQFPKLLWGEVEVAVTGGFFETVPDPEIRNPIDFFADQCQLSLPIPWWPPQLFRPRLNRLFNEICRISEDGKTRVPMKLSGRIRFQLDGRQEETRIWLVHEGEEYRLVMNQDDLRRIAGYYLENVSDPEIAVLARYPLWVLRALHITDQARKISRETFQKDPSVPEDAFRHVWWSYHLTKTFGPEFSKELTDAHEAGSTTNTEADHIMDYRNNQIGTDYALQGYPAGSLLERTMKDPDVIRSAAEIYRATSVSDDL